VNFAPPEVDSPATITQQLDRTTCAAAALAICVRTTSVRAVLRDVAASQLDAVRLGRRTLSSKDESIERHVDERSVDSWRSHQA